MRSTIFAYTPPSIGPGFVPYTCLGLEDDGRVTLRVRSSGASDPSVIELPEAELDRLAAALASRHLLKRLEAMERRLSEVDQRTTGMIRFGPAQAHIPFHADLIRPVSRA